MNTKISSILTIALLSATAAFGQPQAVEPEFVDTLVKPYLELQEALASDDLAAAKVGAKAYLDAVQQAPSEAAKKEVAALRQPAQQIASAAKIDVARQSFLTLSNEMQALVKTVGTATDTQLFVVHCPMAFSGKGGSWLQSDKTVSNPYYGKSMLRCGSIKAELGGEGSNSGSMNNKSDGHDPMKHDHSSMNPSAIENSYSPANLDAVHAGVAGYTPVLSEAKQQSAMSSCGMKCCAAKN